MDLFLNGVDGVTGERLPQLPSRALLASLIRSEKADPRLFRWLKDLWLRLSQPHLGLPFCTNPRDIAQAGWAVVFHVEEEEPVRTALAPLVEHRRSQVPQSLLKVLDYHSGEDWRTWLARHQVEPGSLLPHRVPYYLLLVGSPVRIPFELQHMLSVEYAVGRISFDNSEGYIRYIESLIDYESAAHVPQGREAAFFAPRHPSDPATELSASQLAQPLAERGPAERTGFRTSKLLGEAATRTRLTEILHGNGRAQPPALLFSASHGLGWPKGHPEQRSCQGALVCQDWPGPGTIRRNHYYTAADLEPAARIHGLVAFLFACFGAGTPQWDDFQDTTGKKSEIADSPFIGALPQALLAHPRGGALAVIGHVDRAWGYSILGWSGLPQILPFENALTGLLLGWPVGHAMSTFRERYAALSSALADMLVRINHGGQVPDEELTKAWMERNDARNYVVLGDPAARLRIEAMAD